MKKFTALLASSIFLFSFHLAASQITLAPAQKGGVDPLAKFKPLGTTGFSQFAEYIIRVSPDRKVELFSPEKLYLPAEPIIYIQRNPKSTFENPEFLVGGSTKDGMICFDWRSARSDRDGGPLSRTRLAGLSLVQQLEKAGFIELQSGVFAYRNDDGVEIGYALVENGTVTQFLQRNQISFGRPELDALPLTLLDAGTTVVKAQYSFEKDQTRSFLLMENSIGKFKWGLPIQFEMTKALDQLDGVAFGSHFASAIQKIGQKEWEKNREALDPPHSLQQVIEESDKLAASLPVSREKIAEYLYRISAGLDRNYLSPNGMPFELSPNKKFKMEKALESMGSVQLPVNLPQGVSVPNLSATLTNLTSGKTLRVNFVTAALIASYGISQGTTPMEGGDVTLAELAELFK